MQFNKSFMMNFNKYIHMHKHFCALEGTVGEYDGALIKDKTFKFANIVWQVIEDNLDDYRSMLDYIVYCDKEYAPGLFTNVATVKLQRSKDYKRNVTWGCWILTDVVDQHIWLKIGTDYADELFPRVIFKHCPKVL